MVLKFLTFTPIFSDLLLWVYCRRIHELQQIFDKKQKNVVSWRMRSAVSTAHLWSSDLFHVLHSHSALNVMYEPLLFGIISSKVLHSSHSFLHVIKCIISLNISNALHTSLRCLVMWIIEGTSFIWQGKKKYIVKSKQHRNGMCMFHCELDDKCK